MDDDCSSEIVTEDVPERRHKVSTRIRHGAHPFFKLLQAPPLFFSSP
jgi:hypothetical protein